MDRGAWRATVHGVTGDGHDLATKERERENFNSGALPKKKKKMAKSHNIKENYYYTNYTYEL